LLKISTLKNNQKLTLLNDPIYGFIHIHEPIIFKLLEHPFFQRLRRISQMGLSSLVYPGARHSRFEHALGCVHLMQKTISILRTKGIAITDEESIGMQIAILLHDIGHGPFSHAMENSIVEGVHHESLSLKFMNALNNEFKGQLTLAISIFQNQYKRKFMYQLVSGQIDLDRMDYLKRDSFYTAATEGNINSERIITMFNVVDDQLVIEEKGMHSVEKFLIARRLMYWQVYLHKTSLVAELLLERLLKHARILTSKGEVLKTSNSLSYFLNRVSNDINSLDLLKRFALLDDYDIVSSLKEWQNHSDFVLSDLSSRILNRNLLKIRIQNNPFTQKQINEKIELLSSAGIKESDIGNYVFTGEISNQAYVPDIKTIMILTKSGEVNSLQHHSELFVGNSFSNMESKFYLCFAKPIF
jgi:HD superfamily phosphohydrolase